MGKGQVGREKRFTLMTYDPGYDEDLHPGEGGGLHSKELRRMIVGGHVR